MRINMNQPIVDWFGKNVKVPAPNCKMIKVPDEKGRTVEVPAPDCEMVDLLLKNVCLNALGAGYQDETNLSGDEKFKRYHIGLKIVEAGDTPVDLPIEDVNEIKKLSGKLYASPTLVGGIWKLLENPIMTVKE